MNMIFDSYLKKLPPGHLNPQKAVTEQVLFNSLENEESDMRLDNDHFKLAIEKGEDYILKLETEKLFDEGEQSFFKLD